MELLYFIIWQLLIFLLIVKRNVNNGLLNKAYILSKVSQITIFSTYLDIPDNIIQDCINNNTLILSPLRDDIHPTCGFRYDNKGKLKLRDFAGYFWGDCFDAAAMVINEGYNLRLNVNNKQDFVRILKHIMLTFKDIFYGTEKDENLINTIHKSISSIRNKKQIIDIVVRPWNTIDENYWKQFNIDLHFLNTHFVYAVDQYYINRNVNPQPKYYYDKNDLCYAYLLGQDKHGVRNIKLYFPNRKKATTRFITNCNHLEGIYNLNRDDYDIIVITKSTKDRLSLESTINQFKSLHGAQVGVINIPHETYRLRDNEYDWILNKLPNGFIVSLMDNDRTGKTEAIWLRDNYNIKPILIPQEYNSKDFSELVTNISKDKLKSLVCNTIKDLQDAYTEELQYFGYSETDGFTPF